MIYDNDLYCISTLNKGYKKERPIYDATKIDISPSRSTWISSDTLINSF